MPGPAGEEVGAAGILGRVSSDKPRILQNSRDMLLSLAAMAVIMFIAVGTTGLCSFNPGRPEQGMIPRADVQSFLKQENQRAPYPVVEPRLPEGWTANSTRAGMIGPHQTSIIGYVTPEESYVQVLQTDAPADMLPDPDQAPRVDAGTMEAGGVTWQVSEGTEPNVRRTWVADLGDVRVEIQGSASDEMYRTLAEAVVKAHAAAPAKPEDPGAPAQDGAPQPEDPTQDGAPAQPAAPEAPAPGQPTPVTPAPA